MLFELELNKAYPKNSRVPLIELTSNPNYFDDDAILVSTPVMPAKNFLTLLSRGPNADLKVHLLMHQVESNLENALKEGFREKAEINILFSPACSSFDQFKNFEQRGRCFKKYLKKILKND